MIAEVIVDISNNNVDRVFDYTAIDGVTGGCRVLVPFGPRKIEGYVLSLKEKSDYEGALKTVDSVLDDYPVIHTEMLSLMRRVVAKYRWRIVDVLRLFLPAQMRGGKVRPLKVLYATLNASPPLDEMLALLSARAPVQAELAEFLNAEGSVKVADLSKRFSASAVTALVKKGFAATTKERLLRRPYNQEADAAYENVELTDEQNSAFRTITEKGKGTFLLHGVTGSGKTEVYMRVILDCLAKGKTAIMLVPEISLTPQVLRLFRAKFGSGVALLHSGLSAGERFDEWTRLREGAATVAIGARSAVFAPLENLGAVIIDEEHDSSYVSEMTPQYNTHEIAAIRAEYNGCPLILGSATPSLDSYFAAKNGDYTLIEMNGRINRRALPDIRVIDMCAEVRKGNSSFLSQELQYRLDECVKSRHQAILFLNRRGYASFQQCRSCGFVVKCEDCDVPMVFHYDEDKLKCHYCSRRTEPLTVCPECGSHSIRQGSIGTERAVTELQRLYPSARILRLDRDTTTTKDGMLDILNAFRNHEADILVGTQMVAKGHDFGDCTLVGILEADLGLYGSDYRAVERTFQLITQVSGRAGRAAAEGSVVLQTYSPRHYVFRYAVAADYKGFYDKEINLRETTGFPPFSTVVRILVSGEDEGRAIENLRKINDDVKVLRDRFPQNFAYAKSMRAPRKKLLAKHRVQMIVRIVGENSDEILTQVCGIAESNRDEKLTTVIEVNPQNLQ